MENDENKGYVSSNGLWAAIPWGNKYVSVFGGKQICTHNTLETAIKFIQKENRKKR